MPEIICKMHFSTVSALTYQVFLKKFICRRFLFAFYRNFHSNFSHLNFSTWILICQAALNFNCRHFFHISNWILEITFSSEIYWRLLSNLNIKTSKVFFGTCLVKDWDWTGRFLRAISKFNFCFLLMSWRIQNARPISNIYIYTYMLEMCGGTKPCNILRWVSQTFKKTHFSISKPWMKSLRYRFQIFEKFDVNLKSLNGKFKNEKIKVLQKKPQYRIFEWKKSR